MSTNMAIMVGTIGQGVMRSTDCGDTWEVLSVSHGLYNSAIVRALLVNPKTPENVLAGTEKGLFASTNSGLTWTRQDVPLSQYCVWTLESDPTCPEIIFAGTGTPDRVTLFRSSDGGCTWEQMPVEVVDECPAVGIPRITDIAIDPNKPECVWMGIEVDGIRRSIDGGSTWHNIEGGVPNPDVHAVAVTGGKENTVFVVVNDDVYTSSNDGDDWHSLNVQQVFPWHYPRAIAIKPDNPQVIFLGVGDSTPGKMGAIMRSEDNGRTWQAVNLPVQPNTAIWNINIQPFNPNIVFAGSRFGYLYRSDDGGVSWRKLWREFSEISSIVWTPI